MYMMPMYNLLCCVYIMCIRSLVVLKARDNLIKIVKYLADFA